jgi:hypothetical protein
VLKNTSVRPCTASLAIASASILALSLVTAPFSSRAAHIMEARTEVHAVQLAAVSAADIFSSAVVNTAAGAASSVVSPRAPTTAAATSPAVHAGAASAATVGDDVETIAKVLGVFIFPLWILTAPITLLPFLVTSIQYFPIGPLFVFGIWASVPFAAAYDLVGNLVGQVYNLVGQVYNFVRSLLPGAAAQPNSTASTTAAQTPTSATETADAQDHVTGTAAPTRAHSGRNLVNDVRRPNSLAGTVTDKPATATAGNAGHTPPAAGVGETNSNPDQDIASGKKRASSSAAAHSARSSTK